MPDIDRYEVLHALDARYDDLARELDQLNERIELALASNGAGAPMQSGATAADPDARSY